jgi:hypothetical protein
VAFGLLSHRTMNRTLRSLVVLALVRSAGGVSTARAEPPPCAKPEVDRPLHTHGEVATESGTAEWTSGRPVLRAVRPAPRRSSTGLGALEQSAMLYVCSMDQLRLSPETLRAWLKRGSGGGAPDL